MKHTITLFAAFLLTIGIAYAQGTMFKMVGKIYEGPAEVLPGIFVEAGDQIELHEGLAPEGFRHIYTAIGGKVTPLGYGANYDIIEVKEIRYNKKYEEYFVLSKISGSFYVVEIDKGLKSGEIKRIIPKEN